MRCFPCFGLGVALQGKPVAAAVGFGALLCFKHTYIYAAPALAVLLWSSSKSTFHFIMAALSGLAGPLLWSNVGCKLCVAL